MAEAEDILVDAARHATVYVQNWQARRKSSSGTQSLAPAELSIQIPRLALLLSALYGGQSGGPFALRIAQAPPPVTLLTRLFSRAQRPWTTLALPCAQATTIWLPRALPDITKSSESLPLLYRAMAVQQAARALARPPRLMIEHSGPLARDIYLVLEAQAADAAITRDFPGLADALNALRSEALRQHPPIATFPPARQATERWLQTQLVSSPAQPLPLDTESLLNEARRVAHELHAWDKPGKNYGKAVDLPLFKDWWTGDWPLDEHATAINDVAYEDAAKEGERRPVRSARLARRPKVRAARENEDGEQTPGAFMIQTAQPHEHAEDPAGAQRPTDRDSESAAEGHAESLAEMNEARLVRSAAPAHEVLLADDAPPTAALPQSSTNSSADTTAAGIAYPEWDYRREAYRLPGAIVRPSLALDGDRAWVERTLEAQRAMLGRIRRQFELLRAHRVNLHRQEDGDEIDIDACIEARADLRAGAALSQRLYQHARAIRRDTAIVVLVDISGSTDGWLAGQRRIIDVEREALLPLSIALDSLGEPHAILAFSGDGPQQVRLRQVKDFDEAHSAATALRIAGLEPEDYTRAGAALRHATALLAARPARHRLLLLLSDGKPNDRDEYEGRYGVEDMRQAVLEARQAGISPFCLTVDRQAAAYLPHIFGAHHYALLQRPERLPVVLLNWLKRLLVS